MFFRLGTSVSGSDFCSFHRLEVAEQVVDGIPTHRFWIVVCRYAIHFGIKPVKTNQIFIDFANLLQSSDSVTILWSQRLCSSKGS